MATYVNILLIISIINTCNGLPLIPILTALLGSATNVLQVQIDTLGIAKWVSNAVHTNKNRSGFVKDLMYSAFYNADEKYNVLVFNLNEEHVNKLDGIKFYCSVDYRDGLKFGIWVFESGVFTNKGARGWNNWAMIGSFKKDSSGNEITFKKRFSDNKHKKSGALIETKIWNDFRDD